MRKLFGTDGIRGEANVFPLNPQGVVAIGAAAATHFRREHHRPTVVVGRDTRISGHMLSAAISAGLCSQGADVVDVGVVTTPAVAYITTLLGADAGVVISASHNPFADNGIKFFGPDGYKLPDEVELDIEASIEGFLRGADDLPRVDGRDVGAIGLDESLQERYLAHLLEDVGGGVDLSGMTLVVDAAHGAAYRLAPTLLKRLGARIVTLGVDPDGRNINQGLGAVHPQVTATRVVSQGADLGITLDGDADRLIMCDEHGSVVDGDHIMAMAAGYLKDRNRLNHHTVVATVMSNMGMEIALRNMGITMERVAVGDRYVMERMREGGFNLGGEQSGHLMFTDYATTGDGLLSALFVLKMLADSGQTLSELASVMKPLPQTLKNLKVGRRTPIEELPEVMAVIEEVNRRLGDTGRTLVRYSGTENKARVMIEGPDQAAIEAMADRIVAALARALPL